MAYIIFYFIMILVGLYVMKKFDFNYREVLELLSLPIAIPMIGTVVITLFTESTPFTFDTLWGLIGLPLLLAFVVAVVYPLLLLPVLLILIIKQNYGDKPMIFFFLATLIGGLTLSMVSMKAEVVITGMIFTLLSVLTQYYYFDRKRETRSVI